MRCRHCGIEIFHINGPWGDVWESTIDGDAYCDILGSDSAIEHRPEAAPIDPDALARWLLEES